MKSAVSVILAIAFCLMADGPASAESPQVPERSIYRFESLVCPNLLLRACCNRYCPKPQPCIQVFSSGCGRKYCPKPFPWIPCFPSGCSGNCYEPKSYPNLCVPDGLAPNGVDLRHEWP